MKRLLLFLPALATATSMNYDVAMFPEDSSASGPFDGIPLCGSGFHLDFRGAVDKCLAVWHRGPQSYIYATGSLNDQGGLNFSVYCDSDCKTCLVKTVVPDFFAAPNCTRAAITYKPFPDSQDHLFRVDVKMNSPLVYSPLSSTLLSVAPTTTISGVIGTLSATITSSAVRSTPTSDQKSGAASSRVTLTGLMMLLALSGIPYLFI